MMRLMIGCWLAMLVAGCTALQSVTEATKDKSVALGSDTWGGGMEVTAATPESPSPTLSGWFGRRKVWYTSIKDQDTGQAAAAVVRASNSALAVEMTPTGPAVNQ